MDTYAGNDGLYIQMGPTAMEIFAARCILYLNYAATDYLITKANMLRHRHNIDLRQKNETDWMNLNIVKLAYDILSSLSSYERT